MYVCMYVGVCVCVCVCRCVCMCVGVCVCRCVCVWSTVPQQKQYHSTVSIKVSFGTVAPVRRPNQVIVTWLCYMI